MKAQRIQANQHEKRQGAAGREPTGTKHDSPGTNQIRNTAAKGTQRLPTQRALRRSPATPSTRGNEAQLTRYPPGRRKINPSSPRQTESPPHPAITRQRATVPPPQRISRRRAPSPHTTAFTSTSRSPSHRTPSRQAHSQPPPSVPRTGRSQIHRALILPYASGALIHCIFFASESPIHCICFASVGNQATAH